MYRVAVDLDGVLANTMEACCKIINIRHSTHFKPSSFNRWKAWETTKMSKDEFFQILDDAWIEWQSIPPTEEQLADKVDRLLEFGKVDIVTGRSPETVAFAKSWLKRQEIRFDAFVRTNSSVEKAALSYDVFIDDSPELMRVLTLRSEGHGILYTQPWNKEIREMPRVVRANSWNQIPQLVWRLSNAT